MKIDHINLLHINILIIDFWLKETDHIIRK